MVRNLVQQGHYFFVSFAGGPGQLFSAGLTLEQMLTMEDLIRFKNGIEPLADGARVVRQEALASQQAVKTAEGVDHDAREIVRQQESSYRLEAESGRHQEGQGKEGQESQPAEVLSDV